MNISYNWLKTIIPLDLSPEIISETLTDIGLEVEKISDYNSIKGGLEGLIVGEIISKGNHPNADKLSITNVNVGGDNQHQIICGAPNVKIGQKVIVAEPGTTLYPLDGDPFTIKKTKIRGEDSFGMICAEDEIGLSNNHDGIIILDDSAKIGTKAKDYFNVEDDSIFEIGLTPNRADAMGHYGVARDLLAALKYRGLISPDVKLNSVNHKLSTEIKEANLTIEIKNSKACPRYAGIIMKDIEVLESPLWLKNKLLSIGLNPINNIVDISNYVLHELGQPLHIFDLNEITGNKIIVQSLKQDSTFITLDEQKRKLHKDDLMICNANAGMCIAGVFGGIQSGVKSNTTSIFIESAYFDPFTIRKTAKRHGLNTDASFRFERGVDPNMIITALLRAVKLIEEIAGGKIASPVYDHYKEPIEDFIFDIIPEKINKLCGVQLDNSKIISILEFLDIQIIENKKSILKIKVPSYRVDVKRESDIAEEILRIHGYNSVAIPSKLNSSILQSSFTSQSLIKEKISNQLTSIGLTEILSNSLTKRNYVSDLNLSLLKDDEHIELLNPLSSDTSVMRQSLVFNALEVIRYNQKNGMPNVRVFEFGNIYKTIKKKFIEEEHLLIALSGLQNEEHWVNSKTEVTFYQLKGIVIHLFESFGLTDRIVIDPLKNDLFSDGIQLSIDNNILAEIGWPNEKLMQLVELKNEVYVATINWNKLLAFLKEKVVHFTPIVKFPKVYRDLSLLLNDNVKFSALQKASMSIDKKVLKQVHLFDVYMGNKISVGKKSYALRFELLHDSKTLNDKEIDKVMNKIQQHLIDQFNAELR